MADLTEVTASSKKRLEQLGYGLQVFVVDQALEARRTLSAAVPWEFQAIEFPVAAGDGSRTSRIDALFRHIREPIVMVVECKKPNRSHGWCFARMPMARHSRSHGAIILETVELDGLNRVHSTGRSCQLSDPVMNIAWEVKVAKGDDTGDAKNAIEIACTQVIDQMNGMVNAVAKQPHLVRGQHMAILPVIVTAAELFTADIAWHKCSDPSAGIPVHAYTMAPATWLFFEYPQSPIQKHKEKLLSPSVGDYGVVLDREFIRTIAIVNVASWLKFLSSNSWRYEDLRKIEI